MSNTQTETIIMTEKHDENQILANMRGEVVKEWVYTIQQGGRSITSLSYAGVKEAVRRRGNLTWRTCECCHHLVHIDETKEEIRATVCAWDLNNNVEFIGTSSSLKGTPFAWVLAVNKAERNALRKFLPEKAIALLIQEYLNPQKKVA